MHKRIGFAILALAFLLTFVLPSDMYTAHAAGELSGDTGWIRAYPNNNQNDYLEDQQTGSGSVSQDIIGDATYPSTYMRLTSTELAFRIRVNDINGTSPYQYKNFAFVGIDSDVNGSVDFFLGVYNPTGNNGRVGIYSADSGYANISPSTTGISGKPLLAFLPQFDVNYAISLADSSLDSTQDYFISFKFSIADISKALQGTGYTFSASKPFRFMTGTAAQDNSFNQDLNGMDKTGWSSSGTWNALGVYSDTVTADGLKTYYTVVFDKNTGDTDASPAIKPVEANQPLGSLPATNPTKRGMFFQEWNTAPDGTGTKVTASTVITGNTTFYAIWSNNRVYNVTFNPNGGNFGGSTASITVPTINGVVGDNMPAAPVQGGKFFSGWNTLANGTGTFFNSATPVTSDVVVYAQWENSARDVAIFYDNPLGSSPVEVSRAFTNGNSGKFSNNDLKPSITKPGYNFTGWFLEDVTNSGLSGTTIDSPGKYYAHWTAATYTVTFDQNYAGKPADTTKDVNNGLLGALPADPTRDGFKFIEWNRSADATGEAMYPTSQISANTRVYAIWKPIQTVSFDPNNGLFGTSSSLWTTTTIDGKLAMFPQPPNRDNYTFMGWTETADVGPVVSLSNIGAITKLYALWAPIYTVTFNENYGATPTTLDVPTAYGGVLYMPQDPLRTGYTFSKWTAQADGGGGTFSMATNVASSTSVFAQWTSTGTPSSFTVTLDPASGSGGTASVSATTGSAMPAATAPTRTGYTFGGYYDSSSKQYYDSSMNSVAAWDKNYNDTLTAKWTANDYAVTFNANGGKYGSDHTLSKIVSQTYNSKYVLPLENPVQSGFTFAGWNTLSSGAGANISTATTMTNASAHTIYASWTSLGNVTIGYNSANISQGSVSRAMESLNPETGTALGSTATPEASYEFVKWIDGGGNTVGTSTSFVPAKGMGGKYVGATYTAVFKAVEHAVTVTVKLDDVVSGGKIVQLSKDGGVSFVSFTEQADHTYQASLPNGTYMVWIDGDNTGKSITVSNASAAGELLYYTLVLEKGTGISGVSGAGVFLKDAMVSPLSATVSSGYVWSKWVSSNTSLLSDQASNSASFAMPAGRLTLTATATATSAPPGSAGGGSPGSPRFTISVRSPEGPKAPGGTTPSGGSITLSGSITPKDTVSVSGGSSTTFVITPPPGKVILDVLVDGVSVGPVDSYTFSDVSEDHTISAVFGYSEDIPLTGDNKIMMIRVILVGELLILALLWFVKRQTKKRS